MTSLDGSKKNIASFRLTRAQLLGAGVALLAVVPASASQRTWLAREPRFEDGARSSGWIELQRHIGGHLSLKVLVNGRETLAVLDSAAARTTIDSRLADRLGLVQAGEMGAAGLTGSTVVPLVGGVTVLVGKMAVDVTAAAADLSQIFSGPTAPEIVLGFEVFEALDVDLDLPRRRVAFHLDPPGALTQPSTSLPLRIGRHGARHVPVSIEGRSEVPALYDLGSNVPIYISPKYAAASELLDGRATSTALSAGIEGRSLDRVLTLTEVRLGDIRLTGVPAAVPPAWSNEAPAVLGAPLLSRFRTLISFRGARVVLSPDVEAVNAPFPKDRSGIGALRLADRLRVAHVAPGSPAEAAGLVAGDEIVRVNGQPINEDFYRRNPRMGAMPAGTVHEIRLVSGKQVEVVLRDYY